MVIGRNFSLFETNHIKFGIFSHFVSLYQKATALEWIKHYLGKMLRKPDWLIYEVKAEKIIIHPEYSGKGKW